MLVYSCIFVYRCCSLVGRVGGKQALSLKDYCATQGVAIHELGHVIGFWHEHTRPDRDSFIKILWNNIRQDRYDNFVKRQYIEIESFGRPYDFSSIMHYSPVSFLTTSYTILCHSFLY